MGKSTTAQILAREEGYVYYEADCFTQLKNPYIALDEPNPSMAQVNQKNLKGPGMKERQALYDVANGVFSDVLAGKDHDKEEANKVYSALAEDIKREKERIGGDWAVAHVVMSREGRDNLRKILGPQLIFILLSMPSEDRRKRILSRHKGDEGSVEMMDVIKKLEIEIFLQIPTFRDLRKRVFLVRRGSPTPSTCASPRP